MLSPPLLVITFEEKARISCGSVLGDMCEYGLNIFFLCYLPTSHVVV